MVYRITDSAELVTMANWMKHPDFRDLNRLISHKIPLVLSKANATKGDPVPEAELRYLYDRIWMNWWGEARQRGFGTEETRCLQEKLDRGIWPVLADAFKTNPGAVQFLKEYGVWSPRLDQFLVDSWKSPGLSMLPAQLLAHDPLSDEIVVLEANDALFPFCFDQTFRMINYRQNVERDVCKNPEVKKVFVAGGGLLLSFLTGGYPLGHDGQKLVVYDRDEKMIPYIEKVLNGKLSDYGIDYRIGDFMDGLKDESQYGEYDAVLFGGVLIYNMPMLDEIISMAYELLAPGGVLDGDLQIFSYSDEDKNGMAQLIYGFDAYVIQFPKMEIRPNYAVAVDEMSKALKNAGFDLNKARFSTEPFDKSKGESPAGMITVVRK